MSEAKPVNSEINIRPAVSSESQLLTELGVRSKAAWGYSSEEMAVFRAELTVSPADLQAAQYFVLTKAETVIGYYCLLPLDALAIELQHLFIDPPWMRQGFGSQLFQHARSTASEGGFQQLVIQSDPNAADFYLKTRRKTDETDPVQYSGANDSLL